MTQGIPVTGDTLRHTFDFLNVQDLANVRLVCKQWYSLASDNTCWWKHFPRLPASPGEDEIEAQERLYRRLKGTQSGWAEVAWNLDLIDHPRTLLLHFVESREQPVLITTFSRLGLHRGVRLQNLETDKEVTWWAGWHSTDHIEHLHHFGFDDLFLLIEIRPRKYPNLPTLVFLNRDLQPLNHQMDVTIEMWNFSPFEWNGSRGFMAFVHDPLNRDNVLIQIWLHTETGWHRQLETDHFQSRTLLNEGQTRLIIDRDVTSSCFQFKQLNSSGNDWETIRGPLLHFDHLRLSTDPNARPMVYDPIWLNDIAYAPIRVPTENDGDIIALRPLETSTDEKPHPWWDLKCAPERFLLGSPEINAFPFGDGWLVVMQERMGLFGYPLCTSRWWLKPDGSAHELSGSTLVPSLLAADACCVPLGTVSKPGFLTEYVENGGRIWKIELLAPQPNRRRQQVMIALRVAFLAIPICLSLRLSKIIPGVRSRSLRLGLDHLQLAAASASYSFLVLPGLSYLLEKEGKRWSLHKKPWLPAGFVACLAGGLYVSRMSLMAKQLMGYTLAATVCWTLSIPILREMSVGASYSTIPAKGSSAA